MITVDYTTTPKWLITIPKSDLTLDTGTKYTLDVDVFWQLLRDYADSEEGIVNPVIYTRIAATASTPSITEINIDYFSLQFEDGTYSVNIVNGNTNIRDAEIKNTVSVNTNNTTGFIDPVFLELGTFEGAVHIDETNGSAGTAYPIGTSSTPVSNWTDAHSILDTRGLLSFTIYGSSTLIGIHNFSSGHIFSGFSPITASLVVDTSVNVLNCEFNSLQISGVLDGNSVFRECIVGTVSYINGFIHLSALEGTITLGGSADASIHSCWQRSKANAVTIDMGGSGQQLALTEYQGDVTVINNTGSSVSFISGHGKVTFSSTISSGIFTVYGDMEVVDNSTGTASIINKTSSKLAVQNIERAVWIDTEQVAAGTGTQADPYNSLTSAIDFAETEGIKTLYIYADIVVDRLLKNFKVIGIGTPTIDCNGQNLNKSEFSHCKMQGTYTGTIIVQESVLLSTFNLNGYFEKCGLNGDLTCVNGSTVLLIGCISTIAGLGRPTISMNAAGTSKLSIRKNGGGLTIKDCNNALDEVTVEVSEGSLTFDSSNTDGVMVARGMCKFVNATNGSAVTDETGNPANVNISDKILRNRTETDPVSGVMTVYDNDNTTVLFTANIWENVAGTNAYSGGAINRKNRFA